MIDLLIKKTRNNWHVERKVEIGWVRLFVVNDKIVNFSLTKKSLLVSNNDSDVVSIIHISILPITSFHYQVNE